MADPIRIRQVSAADRGALRRAIVDLQDYERALHDSRQPGTVVVDAYIADLEARCAKRQGLIVIAEDEQGGFAGYSAGWVQQDDTIAETPDSNRFGYVVDCYVVPASRGLGVAGKLLATVEAHLWKQGVTRIRIGSLATNMSALRAYRKHGFAPYEVVLEKRRPASI